MDANATPGAMRHYWPAVMNLVPDDLKNVVATDNSAVPDLPSECGGPSLDIPDWLKFTPE